MFSLFVDSFILSVSLFRQLSDLFYISTQLHPEHHWPKQLQQQYLYSCCPWPQAGLHRGEPEAESSRPQPDLDDQQQPDFKEADSDFGPQQHQHWTDKPSAPERYTSAWRCGCGAVLSQNRVPVCFLDHHAGLCVRCERPADHLLYIWSHDSYIQVHRASHQLNWARYDSLSETFNHHINTF